MYMLCAYIMAGGSGERFWPLSTSEKPKQLLKLFSDKSMIRETVDRILPLIPAERIFIGTNIKQAKGILEELPMLPPENVVIEPSFKDTAAAIGYGALYIKARVKDGCMVVLASDHLISDPDNFRKSVEIAAHEAINFGSIVTLGIKPNFPETGYGYIETTKDYSLESVYSVERFWEKPDKERAEGYVAAGNFLWNSGMFIFSVTTILEEIKHYMPNHYNILEEINQFIEQGIDKENLSNRVAPYFEKFQKISIDFGIMEQSKKIKVIPSDFGWNDIGSFNALGEVFEPDSEGNIIRTSHLRSLDCSNNVIISDNYEVGVIGISDVIIVQTEGKLLICHKDRAQDIKKIL
jgi:mannose-1-phosphate guanylyltransferase